jgi:hypothetical protein
MTNGTANVAVGVLLPVRIETRFDGPRLRLRVVPDDPWLDRHDPLPRAGELDALERYLTGAGDDATSPDARQAWRSFAGHVGGGRAVWLVRTFPVVRVDPDGTRHVSRPANLRADARFPELPDFPQELQVWLARAGGPPTLALTLAVDRSRLRADFPDPNDVADRRWWESWDEAVAAGLAGEIDLGATPGDIDVLYVVGLGDGDPARLFAAHTDAGRLGLLAPGRPTNTVDAAPAADLADEPDTWLDVLLGTPSATQADVSAALTGVPGLLGALPGDDEPHRDYAEAIVAGLWPALWGFAQADVWDVPAVAEAAAWAVTALYPEGPYPTLRIGVQPFGLLPATALAAWQAAPNDPQVEAGMRRALVVLRDAWAAAAEGRGTIDGVHTDGLLERLAHVPTAPGYRHRAAWPLELWLMGLLYLGYPLGWPELDRAWENQARLARALPVVPGRRYAAYGGSAALRLPLVVPAALRPGDSVGAVLRRLLTAVQQRPSQLASMGALEEILRTADSLLLRLAIRALQVAVGDIGRTKLGEPTPALDPVSRPDRQPARLERWISAVAPADLSTGTPQADAFKRVLQGLGTLAGIVDADAARVERLLRATVDCATYRIDPWVVGPAARRLRDLATAPAAGSGWRLGAYGWVDGPRPGTPGPTAAGMLHAPSQSQATAAMVLRDRAVNDPEPGRWHMDLTSTAVRTADRLAVAVRAGAHLSEALGGEVERLVGDHATVERLRRDFPVREEHAGRRVCDGQAVLAADPATLGLPAGTLTGLAGLRSAVDAYGDLLVADAVYDVLEGRAETAGAVMDAAAGLARPPELSILRTRRDGRGVSSTCVVVLPAVPPPALPTDPASRSEVSPGTLAEPAFAAFLTAQLGDAAGWTWTTATGTVVTLASLGLGPVDALALSLDDLERLVADAAGGPIVTGTGSTRYRLAVRLATMLGQTPATADTVAEDPTGSSVAVDDSALLQRYRDVRAVGVALQGRLQAGSAAEQTAGLAAALRWGIAPQAPPGAADPTAVRVARAASLLDTRLRAAPIDGSLLQRGDLVRALTTLVSPTGQLAILGRLPRGALPATLTLAPTLDDTWLTMVASVRESLARLEVHQLAAASPAAAGPALTAWSNRVGDPWQTTAPYARLVAAYAPVALDLATVPAGQDLAVALLDRWSETIPSAEHTTSVVFGFDAPAARPPQAILLAVPPDPGTPLDPAGVVAIVAETRLLAHARMARPADLDAARALVPTALLPSQGAMRVPLDPTAP